jgi:hypothetical protein
MKRHTPSVRAYRQPGIRITAHPRLPPPPGVGTAGAIPVATTLLPPSSPIDRIR